MTLEQKAEEYANHHDWFEFSANVDKIGNAIKTKMKQAYIASAKEMGIELSIAKQIIRELLDTPRGYQSGCEWYENKDYNEVISKAEAFLNKE